MEGGEEKGRCLAKLDVKARSSIRSFFASDCVFVSVVLPARFCERCQGEYEPEFRYMINMTVSGDQQPAFDVGRPEACAPRRMQRAQGLHFFLNL